MYNFMFYRFIIVKNNWKSDYGVFGYMYICILECLYNRGFFINICYEYLFISY